MRKLFLFFLRTEVLARNMLAPDGGLLGAIAAKRMTKGNRRQSEDAAARLATGQDHCVLELGPGSGWGTRILASGKPKRLVAVEVSARFRQELAALELPIGLEVRGDDAVDMSAFLETGSIDRMLAVNVVNFLDPLADYAAELFRVMAPGGRGLLASKSAIERAHDGVFVNKDQQAIMAAFEQSGFRVSSEDIDLADPVANYTAGHLTK